MEQRKRKRHKFKAGDIFAIPINPDTYHRVIEDITLVGQVLDDKIYTFDSMLCAFFDIDQSALDLNAKALKLTLISIQYVTREALKSNEWRYIANIDPIPVDDRDIRKLVLSQEKGFSAISAGVILMLLSAYRGLLPWNFPKDENFLDGLLVEYRRRPPAAYFK